MPASFHAFLNACMSLKLRYAVDDSTGCENLTGHVCAPAERFMIGKTG